MCCKYCRRTILTRDAAKRLSVFLSRRGRCMYAPSSFGASSTVPPQQVHRRLLALQASVSVKIRRLLSVNQVDTIPISESRSPLMLHSATCRTFKRPDSTTNRCWLRKQSSIASSQCCILQECRRTRILIVGRRGRVLHQES